MLDETLDHLSSNRRSVVELCLRITGRRCPSRSFEILVVDDGSTDGTAEVVRRYARKVNNHDRVRLLRQPHGPDDLLRDAIDGLVTTARTSDSIATAAAHPNDTVTLDDGSVNAVEKIQDISIGGCLLPAAKAYHLLYQKERRHVFPLFV